jgi:Reverse transcriptase (RNA-dependent DNA polymerase)
LFDNIVLARFHDKLMTSDLQFGFKAKSSNSGTMVLMETISYYVKNQSSVFCSFLDASKASDHVQYSKLFSLILKRGLPPCIVRISFNLYMVRILWSGLTSDYFAVLNGVKQGAVLSPILFCIYL